MLREAVSACRSAQRALRIGESGKRVTLDRIRVAANVNTSSLTPHSSTNWSERMSLRNHTCRGPLLASPCDLIDVQMNPLLNWRSGLRSKSDAIYGVSEAAE